MAVKAVLMIDDDSEDQEIFEEIVHEIDPSIKCVTISSAEKALLLLKEKGTSAPDLIFVDLNMPIMDGSEFLREIKAVNSLKHIPAVVYSTSSEKKQMKEAIKLGASSFMTKPSDLSVLRKQLEMEFAAH